LLPNLRNQEDFAGWTAASEASCKGWTAVSHAGNRQSPGSRLPTHTTEDIMAKKTTKKKAPAKTTKKAKHVEIEFDAVEITAIKLASSSAKVHKKLAEAASLAISQAVRKVFKQQGISLAPLQAQRVAEFLFGE
jgi:hypothetical protein